MIIIIIIIFYGRANILQRSLNGDLNNMQINRWLLLSFIKKNNKKIHK